MIGLALGGRKVEAALMIVKRWVALSRSADVAQCHRELGHMMRRGAASPSY